MPAKKTASKKRKKAGTARKKAASKKAVSRKKTTGKKTKVTRKKAASKKSKKKAVSRKKAAAKKQSTKKKVSKKASGKKSKSKAGKKTAKKKASKKKSASRKKSPAKKASAKKTSAKKASAKKASAKKTSTKKKPASKKKASKKKAPARQKAKPARSGARSDVLSGPIHGIEPYKPARNEDYMNAEQLEHFRAILLAWKRELMNEVDRTLHHMQDEAANFPDPNDRATQESEFGLELRTRDRERKLLRKINSALARIDDGTYGYCEETGEEIGLKRLEARPVATMCVEAQERREMAERQFRDRDDRYR